MSLLYYNAIFKNEAKANAVYRASYSNFNMFKEYLDIAIQTQKSKRVSVEWEEAEEAVVSNIKCLVRSFKYELNTTIQFKKPDNIYLLFGKVANNIEIFDENKISISTQSGINNLHLNKEQFIKLNDDKYYVLLDEKLSENRMMTVLNDMYVVNLEDVTLEEIDIDTIRQNNNDEFIPIKLEVKNNIVSLTFRGDLNTNEPLIVNGIPILDYYFLENNTYADIMYKNGKKLNVIKRDVNNVTCTDMIDNSTELFMNGTKINHKMIKVQNPKRFFYKDTWHYLNQEGDQLKLAYNSSLELNKPIKVRDENDIEFEVTISRNRRNNKTILVRLLDDDNDDDDMVASFSKLDYFFEDGVMTVDNGLERSHRLYKEFKIDRKNREENTLELRSSDWRKEIKIEDLPNKLFLPINTYQLNKQLKAIQNIKFNPLLEHKGLISLVERKEENNTWPNFSYTNVDEWHVLTDESRDGTLKQREFVKGAISTPDFMLLEGPPGSGKTTAIVELIVQLIKRKKRILLSASTHVAIDNVLERLKDSEGNLFKGILPIRIGDSINVSREAAIYTIDNTISKDIERFKEIILDSANLVCGTTMGILQHPLLKRDVNNPINPEFDYLIIDESSKTTFQEFLVPALYAKKWVLVGDIKQLSPFTDKDHIVANLSDFMIDNGTSKEFIFKSYEQQAALLLFKFFEKEKLDRENNNFMSIKATQDEVKAMISELRHRIASNPSRYAEKAKYVGFVVDSKLGISDCDDDNFFVITKEDIIEGNPRSWIMSGLSLLFIDSTIFNEVTEYIPSNKINLGSKDWEDSKEYFKANAYYKNRGRDVEVRDRNRRIIGVSNIIKNTNEFLQTKKWADEVAWRTIRKYDLRLSNKRKDNYDRDIELLIPSINRNEIMSKIDVVHSIALPSTLECLQRGVPTQRTFKFSSVLNSGFNESDREKRHIVLDYQHRMHSDISIFPRNEFYNNEALRDSKKVIHERDWDYDRYKARNIWINVDGSTYRNYNDKEVKVLMNELKRFIEWTKGTNKKWTVACLTFYKGQERKLREELRTYCNQKNRTQNFEKNGVEISLYTIDKFQGREADITFISMVQTNRVGFLDSPNRLNVALTRARYQRVIIGKRSYFANQNMSEALKNLALSEVIFNEGERK